MARSNLDYDSSAQRPRRTSGRWKGFAGLLLVFAGVCIAIHYWVFFETTIEVEDWLHRSQRVQDAGLVQNRTIGTVVGIAATVLGGALLAISPRRR